MRSRCCGRLAMVRFDSRHGFLGVANVALPDRDVSAQYAMTTHNLALTRYPASYVYEVRKLPVAGPGLGFWFVDLGIPRALFGCS